VVAGGAGLIGGPFTLTDETGATVTDADVLTKPSLIYFGYTSCPDVCPADTARNAEAIDALEDKGYDVTPVFISVDPKRDTPEMLAEWTDYIHPRLIGLTGTKEQIDNVTREYRAQYSVPESTGDEFYLVSHTVYSYLTLPGQGTVEFFGRDAAPEDMANQIACYIDASS
jgi:protein SCO1/2